jgi:hypothetical protein
MFMLETFLSIAVGLGLSAACGFRVFVPLLALSLASMNGYMPLASGFEWIGTMPALIAFGTATALEVLAYYIPWFDHVLDTIATPTAVVAGVVTSASVLTDVPPLLKWSVAIIGGGSAAGLVQGATVLARLKSTALTGGIGNPLLSTLELFGSVTTTVLAIVVPIICLLIVIGLCFFIFRASRRLMFGRRDVT